MWVHAHLKIVTFCFQTCTALFTVNSFISWISYFLTPHWHWLFLSRWCDIWCSEKTYHLCLIVSRQHAYMLQVRVCSCVCEFVRTSVKICIHLCVRERDREWANQYANEVRAMTLFVLLLSLKYKLEKMQCAKQPTFMSSFRLLKCTEMQIRHRYFPVLNQTKGRPGRCYLLFFVYRFPPGREYTYTDVHNNFSLSFNQKNFVLHRSEETEFVCFLFLFLFICCHTKVASQHLYQCFHMCLCGCKCVSLRLHVLHVFLKRLRFAELRFL